MKSRVAFLGTAIAIFALLSPHRDAQSFAQDIGNRFNVVLERCDEAKMREYIRIVIGEGFRDVTIRDSAGRCSTAVWSAGRKACFKPLPNGCGLLPLPGGTDSLRFWLYAHCDTAAEREQLCWAVPAGNTSLQMAVLRGKADGLVARQDVDLGKLVFPPGSNQSGSNLPVIQQFSLIPANSRAGSGILAMTIEDNSVGNHPHSDAREGFWYCVGDSLVWVGSLWRGLYTVWGAESSRGFEGDLDLRKSGDGPATFDYFRTFKAEEGVWFGKLKDILPTVIQVDSLGLRVLGLKVTSDSILPLRNSFPMLVADRLFADAADPACPPEVVQVPLFAQAGIGEPLMGPGRASGRGNYLVPVRFKRPINETLTGWVEGDTLVLTFCMPDERKVAFWFAPPLSANVDDSTSARQRRVYVVHPHWRTSPFRVEGYQVSQGPNGMRYALVDSGVGVFRWFNEGLEVTIRISREQIGFRSIDSLAICGFGMESLWWEYDLPDEHTFEVAPQGFDRRRPETWGNLVLGRREDIINERRLQQHRQLKESRGKHH